MIRMWNSLIPHVEAMQGQDLESALEVSYWQTSACTTKSVLCMTSEEGLYTTAQVLEQRFYCKGVRLIACGATSLLLGPEHTRKIRSMRNRCLFEIS